ncbi:hypothetical protein ECZC16_53450 [Escherichia coli]|nr:hypothetical protein ECZC16_53450 [Escherichia coli]
MPHVAARTASRDRDTGRYQSHRPEQTLLYQIVDEYYPAFAALMAEQERNCRAMCNGNLKNFSKARDAAPAGRASRGQRLQSMPTRSTLL